MNARVLIYGATGYTGKLFARHLLQHDIQPILAGRSANVQTVADELGCEARSFPTTEAKPHLTDVDVLVNLAGPFAQTQTGLIKACIATKTHYLDIAGEVPEMEHAYAFDVPAKEANIVVVPGSGFGVVPTDVAAAIACAGINDATHLTIAYATQGGASRGTLRTILQDIQQPGMVWRNNKAETAKPAMSTHEFTVQGKWFRGVYNPWRADLFTAHRSTAVPNIETFTAFPNFVVSMMKGRLGWLRKLLLNRVIDWLPEGPNAKELKRGKTFIKARAVNAFELDCQVEIVGPEAYQFTVECLRVMLERVSGQHELSGVLPPSAFGTDLLESIPGVSIKTKP